MCELDLIVGGRCAAVPHRDGILSGDFQGGDAPGGNEELAFLNPEPHWPGGCCATRPHGIGVLEEQGRNFSPKSYGMKQAEVLPKF